MKLKKNAKFGEELTCCLKIGIRNLRKFDPCTWSLKSFHFNGLLLSKVYILWGKKVQRNNLSWNWREPIQNLERNQLVASNLAEGIWENLTGALESLKNFHFNGLLLSKVYIVWAKKEQRNNLSWNWREMYFFNSKRNAKFGEESTCCFKFGIRNLTKFDPCTWKSQKFSF